MGKCTEDSDRTEVRLGQDSALSSGTVTLSGGRQAGILNNRAERSIKPFVMGRKDFLFCDTPGGPRSSAVLYSLIETAKETGLGPYRYTQDFIRFHAGGLSGSSRIMIGRKSMIE